MLENRDLVVGENQAKRLLKYKLRAIASNCNVIAR